MQPDLEHAIRLSVGPDRMYRELVYRRGGPLCTWIDEAFSVLARPGEAPNEAPKEGDVLVRVALGEPGLGHVAVLADSSLLPSLALTGPDVGAEPAGRGLYAIVVDGSVFPNTHTDRFARRILDETGRMPLGQVLLRPRPSLAADGESRLAELGDAEPEQDMPAPLLSSAPVVTTTFDDNALRQIPDVLRAVGLARLEASVPTTGALWLADSGRQEGGGWTDRLLIDLEDLPKISPTVEVHVDLFQTVGIHARRPLVRDSFQAYARAAYLTDANPYSATVVAPPAARLDVEQRLGVPLDSLFNAAGLSGRIPRAQESSYKLVVYALFPRAIRAALAPPNHRVLDRFDFDRWTLKRWHVAALKQLAREVVRTWDSPWRIVRITIDGHTDQRGSRPYNRRLGQRRADAVASYMRRRLEKSAPDYLRPLLRRLQVETSSFGKDRLASRHHERNRRVEVTLYRVFVPSPQPLPLLQVLQRLRTLLASQGQMDEEQRKRLRCVLEKMGLADVDDRFVPPYEVFIIERDNRFPGPADWLRVRFVLSDPTSYGPSAPDALVIDHLRGLDLEIREGIAEMQRISDRVAQGGQLALSNAFKQLNAWFFDRAKDESSIYRCYQDMFA